MEANSILLIGAGQLGSRYLQGLAFIKNELSITVADPSLSSLEQARHRLAQMSSFKHHKVLFTTSLDSSPKHFDLALVVTPAHCRADVVAAVINKHQVNAWILEKVLAQSSQQLDRIEKVLGRQSQVWVNTSRRVMAWHKKIQEQLSINARTPLHVKVAGGNWGLACNAIHFIDLVSWWTCSNVYGVDGCGLRHWKHSKRLGFMEVYGTLLVNFSNGSSLELHCDESDDNYQIEILTSEGIWLIDEAAGKAVAPSGQEIVGQLNHQSVLTAPLVEQILDLGSCDLPNLADSTAQHRLFLDALLYHWNHSQSLQDLTVPIT